MSNYCVVIPTRNRRERLLGALRTLETQQPADLLIQVVVVDDGSTDGTAEAVGGYRGALPVTLLANPGRGASAARNAGARAATSECILFIDDDCLAAPNLIAEHDRMRVAHDGPVCLRGRIDWPPDRPVTPFMRYVDRDYQFGTEGLSGLTRLTFGHLVSANLSIPRQTFLDLGGFDEDFIVGFEDTEFGIRMIDAGVPLLYAEDAVVWHDHPATLSAFARRQERFGESAVVFARKCPDYPDVVALGRMPRSGTLRGVLKALFLNAATVPVLMALSRAFESLGLRRAMELVSSQVLSYHYYRGVRRALRAQGLAVTDLISAADQARGHRTVVS